MAVASQIIPSRYTGILGMRPLRMSSSMTSMTSWDLPTAKTGIRTLPPCSEACWRYCPSCSEASPLEGWTSLWPP